jgi:hypothetical protein
MEELLRTNDPTLVPYTSALLKAEDIECFVLDLNMSVLEGSIGVLPRRIMVRSTDLYRARVILTDNGIEPYQAEGGI